MSKKTSKQKESDESYKSVLIRSTIHQKMKVFCAQKNYPIGFFVEFLISKHIAGQEDK